MMCLTKIYRTNLYCVKISLNLNVDADADTNTDADAEMSMLRFPNGLQKLRP